MIVGLSSIEALKANIDYEKGVIREALIFYNYLDFLNDLERKRLKFNQREKEVLSETINSLLSQLKILNDSIPKIIQDISFLKELPSEKIIKPATKESLVSLEYKQPSIISEKTGGKKAFITINRESRVKFLKELSFTDYSIKRLKKGYSYKVLREKTEEFKGPSVYAKISNKLFLRLSNRLLGRGYFKGINSELRKANFYFLSQTYISMAFFSSLLSFFVSIGLLIFLLFFNLSLEFPFLVFVKESILLRLIKNFWIVVVIPILTFLAFYFYPSTEKKSISSKINQEIPFAVIHMSAIAGSGVEPSKIFSIVVMGKEYPNTRKEIKKLLNEINIYGHDLVSALKYSASITSNAKLAELFKGLAMTITSGGGLKEFLDKRADTLIFDYKIEREKYIRMAETFMDIYISVVIAAPMIMTMLLVMISLTGMSFGLTLNQLSLLMILGVALINIFFLMLLHLRQPEM